MNSKRRKAILVALAVVLCLSVQSVPLLEGICPYANSQVYAGVVVSSDITGSASGYQGDEKAMISVEVKNKAKDTFSFDKAVLTLKPAKDVTVTAGSTSQINLAENGTATLNFYMDIDKYADSGDREASLSLMYNGNEVYNDPDVGKVTIYEKISTPESGTGNYVAAVDINHTTKPAEGFSAGSDNTLTLKVTNGGNTMIKNAVMSLTLPEGLSVNNGSNSVNFGYLGTGTHREASFPILVEEDAKSKTYAIEAELTGVDYSNDDVSIKKTFYIPVTGGGSSTALKNLEISNISVPNQVLGKDDFTLSFTLNNRSTAGVKNLKVYVTPPEGILNKTRDTFIEASVPAGSSKDYSITLFAEDASKEKTYSIKIAAAPADAAADAKDSAIQYASVFVKAAAGNSKTPQLMVDRYSYGGSFVQAGDNFVLDLGLYNTSATYNLTNIKVTVSSEDGTIIPLNSNAFYVDSIPTKDHVSQSLLLTVKPAAEQKTTPLTVDMSYEDGAGNPFTAKDTISIPVMQDTRLEVDDVIAPSELYAGMQSGLSVQFYNMGKTVLNNLRVTAEGDFDTQESTSYFVGNMESGKSDTYDFSFIPRQGGTMEGKIIFTYEDAAGNEQTLERPFSFEVMDEMPAFDEEMPEDTEEGKGGKLPWIIGGIVLWLAAIGVFVWRKIRKKKRNREMEIDE